MSGSWFDWFWRKASPAPPPRRRFDEASGRTLAFSAIETGCSTLPGAGPEPEPEWEALFLDRPTLDRSARTPPLRGSEPRPAPRRPPEPAGTATRPAPFESTGPYGHRERMREKVLTRGTDALADYELLEMLLFLAFKQGDTKPLAKSIINRFGSFAGVLSASTRELLETPGLGRTAVTAIRIAQASGIRLTRAELDDHPIFDNWDRLMDYLHAVMARQPIEQFRVLFLDPRNRLIADEAQSRGTVNHTPVYPREVVTRALELRATALLLVHNHPSGDPSPSPADIEMTAEVKQAAASLEIALHDHVVVGKGTWFSFRLEGLL